MCCNVSYTQIVARARGLFKATKFSQSVTAVRIGTIPSRMTGHIACLQRIMVCDDCNQKSNRKGTITPDKWKDGAKNTTESGGRSGKTTNMLLNRGVCVGESLAV